MCILYLYLPKAYDRAVEGLFYFVVCQLSEPKDGYFTAYVSLRQRGHVQADVFNGYVKSDFFVFGGEFVYPETMRGLKDCVVNKTDILFMREVTEHEWRRVTQAMTALRSQREPGSSDSERSGGGGENNETGNTNLLFVSCMPCSILWQLLLMSARFNYGLINNKIL
jgi:hypothetical protein